MYDNLLCSVTYKAPVEVISGRNEPVVFNGHTYMPNRAKGNSFFIKDYTHELNGFQIIINSNKIVIRNSIHNMHKGNNYTDFSNSELRSAIKTIEDMTGVKAYNFELHRLEFALNILCPELTSAKYALIEELKRAKFRDMMNGSKVYGRKCFFSEYSFKIYDKSQQVYMKDRVRIPQNIVRVEKMFRKQRQIKFATKLSDLLDKNVSSLIYNDFNKTLQKVIVQDDYDYSTLSKDEKRLIFAGKNPSYWQQSKHDDNYSYLLHKYNQLLNSLNTSNVKIALLERCDKKFFQLINSELTTCYIAGKTVK